MSGAADALAALRAGVLAHHDALRQAAWDYGNAARAFLAASEPGCDLVAAMQAAPATILAAEVLAAAAGTLQAEARRSLAMLLHEQGITVRTAHHLVSARDASRSVVITDPNAIPSEFMRQPAPVPDKKALAAALAAGPVPGASLSNGGDPVLSITANRKNAA